MKTKYLSLFSFILGLLILSSCSDLEDQNENPNLPLEVTPDLLLPNIIRESVNQVVGENWAIGNIVMQQTAKIQFVNEDRYSWGERSDVWNTFYDLMRDVNNVMTISENSGQNNYYAIGLIWKSWMSAMITDLYGDAPYSEATLAKSANYFPVYDSQESIYEGVQADLKKANELLGSTNEPVSGDILFAGNIDKWKMFANSLRLRYLMRVSDRKDVSADMKEIINNPDKYPIFNSKDDNAQLTYTKVYPNQFPLHTSRVGSFDEYRLSKHLEDTLKMFNDPRIKVFARPTAATQDSTEDKQVYTGIPNGLDDVTALTYMGGAQNISRVGKIYYEEAITETGIQVAKGNIMTYAELQFILAEAAQKGWIEGSAKTYYETGVAAGFDLFATEMPADYLTGTYVAFSDENALQQIGIQKWISFFFNGLEAWSDWRRTGIPHINAGPSNLNNDKVPVRFIYPLKEQSLNSENRNKAVAKQGTDDINTHVWFDIN